VRAKTWASPSQPSRSSRCGQGRDHQRSEHRPAAADVQPETADELLHAGRDGGLVRVLDDDRHPQVIAPHVDGDQDRAGQQHRPGQRGDDTGQHLEFGAAVDAGAFQQLARDLVEEAAEDQHQQRLGGGRIRQDQRPPGVEEVQLLDDQEQRDQG
jgi:hypothetical protein